ncbi:claspin isoform X2 [Monomorium pharaonis]|uniref:claspin isoform X2 n=1 Tax=Monomorium pharaonis TaxID=307658 RepID=UPI00102E1021|nr:claspin isoform X2 [Monomorium pharaonis]
MSKKDFNKRNHDKSDISKDIQKLEEVMRDQKDEKNIEESFKHVVCDIISNEDFSNQEKLENNEISGVNKTHVENELKVDDKKYCDTDIDSTTTIKMKKCINLVASGLREETSLHEASLADNDYYSEACEYLLTAEHKNNLKSKNVTKIIDNEFEDTQISESNNFPHTETVQKNISTAAKSYRTLIDSELEERKQNEEIESQENRKLNKNNNFPETVHNIISTTVENYRTLIDSESEEEKQNDETETNTLITSEETSESKNAKKKLIKKRKGSIRASKDEAMRQIHSETQRLLRETEISLPYHRPKQRTLQEFLNRKKISAALPKAPSIAAKLKMSSAIVNQVLTEKEKEAEFFYKSSDSEDDNLQQSMSFVNKDTERAFITNEKEKILSIDINRTCIQDSNKVETNIQDLQDSGKEIVQNEHLNFDASSEVLVEKKFCKVDHQVAKLSSLTNNNSTLDESDTLLQQINECNQNLSKSRKLFDMCLEKGSNNNFKINLDEQEVTKEVDETIITLLNKENCIDNEKRSKITMTDNQILKIYQVDSEIINEKDTNLITETMKILETHSNNINNEKIIEICKNDNAICLNSDNRNNENKDKCAQTNETSSFSSVINDQSKTEDNPSTDECEESDGHILGLPLPKFADETLSNRKILPVVSDSKVTLRGLPGMIIDLTEDAKPNVRGVSTLLDRFFCKHANTKKQNDNKSEVTVIHLQDTLNGPLPIKEVLPYKVPINADTSDLNKPGAKLMRLKEDLKLQMTLKRNKEWKQKETELQAQKKEDWNEEKTSDLDEQEEAELGLELSSSEESEPEENDICIEDKKRTRWLFADDEAEVTNDEDSNVEENDDEDCAKSNKRSTTFKCRKKYIDDDVSEIETNEEDNDNGENEENEEGSDENIENEIEFDFKVRKNLDVYKNRNDRETRHLTEEFQNDLNIANPSDSRDDSSQLNMILEVNALKTNCEDNNWMSENESNTSACQQHTEIATRNQIYKTPLIKTSMLDFVSPVTQLSVLNTTLDSDKKDSSEKRKCLVDKYEFVSMENTQINKSSEHICNIKNKAVLKKKLFDDVGETIDDEYLMRLCSGKFDSTQKTDLDFFSQFNITESQLDQCSGNSSAKLVERLKNPKVNDKMLQNAEKMLDNDSNNSENHAKEIYKVSIAHSGLKLRVTSSDDEDENIFAKFKKHSVKRLNLSDSEEEQSQFFDEKDDVDDIEIEKQYVDYDSEENEVVVVPEKDIKKVAAGFLEEEAELSESDWDSVDEDEKDLDKLEFEEADDEYIDELEVKNHLEKMHMKQILDEDKREVRFLKELLFEDGDLHTDGTGRERKFKWRNIDKLGNNEIPQMCDENDGWVDVHEDEEEAKWSKLRHERDKFLEERMKCLNNEIENELCDSQIFKLGLEAVKKIKDNELQKQDSFFDKTELSENIEPIMPRNIMDLLNGPNVGKKSQTIYNVIKKRSLLTRGEESLAKIASLAKQGDSAFSASHAVNTRNFVFPHIDQSTDNIIKKTNEVTEDLNSQIKPGKRKMMSNRSSTSKKRRK